MAKLPLIDVTLRTNYSPHVVILGAGASRAAAPTGDRRGNRLPLMADLVDVVGLADVLDGCSLSWRGKDFEALYDGLARDPQHAALVACLEERIHRYFASLVIPDRATVYDYLLISLREKDVIATFNWDPFLMQAYRRHASLRRLPQVLFLHGNVAVGVCHACRVKGPAGDSCRRCGESFQPTRLLYPVASKDYTSDSFIKSEWDALRDHLENAYLVTIFGYSAPATDAAAIELLREVWSRNESRELAQIEIVDIRDEEDLRAAWGPFITRDHYHTTRSIHETLIARYPRRSCEAFAWATLQCDPWPDNRVPVTDSPSELREWVLPLVAEENRQESRRAPFSGLPCDQLAGWAR